MKYAAVAVMIDVYSTIFSFDGIVYLFVIIHLSCIMNHSHNDGISGLAFQA